MSGDSISNSPGAQSRSPGAQSASQGGIVAGGDVSNATTSGGTDADHGSTAASGSAAAAQHGSGAGTTGAATNVGLREKAKKHKKHLGLWGGLCGLSLIAITVLVATDAFSMDWALYLATVILGVIAIIPLFGD